MKTSVVWGSFALLLSVSFLSAQEPPQPPAPRKEHQWLEKFAGEWESDAQAFMGPDQPPLECKGSASAKMLGGFWLVSEQQADMQGKTMRAVQTIGYDPKQKKYVGTWVDSMQSYLWRYEGTVDASGKKLTLEAEGPNFFAADKLAKFRDAYEFKSPDHIVLTSSVQMGDKWVTFMTANMRRKK